MRKPANLVYGVEEAPPPLVVVVTAIQHVGVIAIFMIYPLVLGREAGVSPDVLSNILRMCMFALAVAVLLQALPRGPVGCRFLAPASFTGVYLAPSLLAVKAGGLPLLWERPGVRYTGASDEHGKLEWDGAATGPRLGEKVRLVPGHCDPTVDRYDWYVGVRGGRVECLWPVAARGGMS